MLISAYVLYDRNKNQLYRFFFLVGNKKSLKKVPSQAAGRLIDTLFLLSQARPRLQRGGSSASLHNSLMRNSIFQLMIHTLDPLSEGKTGRQSAHVFTDGFHVCKSSSTDVLLTVHNCLLSGRSSLGLIVIVFFSQSDLNPFFRCIGNKDLYWKKIYEKMFTHQNLSSHSWLQITAPSIHMVFLAKFLIQSRIGKILAFIPAKIHH